MRRPLRHLRSVLRVQPGRPALGAGLRAALATALPLVLSLLLGLPEAGWAGLTGLLAAIFVVSLGAPAVGLEATALRAGWLLFGGLWAMMLSLLLWPLRPCRTAPSSTSTTPTASSASPKARSSTWGRGCAPGPGPCASRASAPSPPAAQPVGPARAMPSLELSAPVFAMLSGLIEKRAGLHSGLLDREVLAEKASARARGRLRLPARLLLLPPLRRAQEGERVTRAVFRALQPYVSEKVSLEIASELPRDVQAMWNAARREIELPT